MSKLKIVLLIGLAVAVAACGGPTATPALVPTAKVALAPTATKAAPPPTAVPASTKPGGGLAVTPAGAAPAPKLDPAGMCKLEKPPQPLPGFPASLPTDHVKGDNTATVTMYEYSDFQ
jgi:hypothetical protein